MSSYSLSRHPKNSCFVLQYILPEFAFSEREGLRMPIAREANQRIEFFRAKRFLAVPEPEKEPLVVLPGEKNILVLEPVIMPFFFNQRFLSVEAWI